MAEEKRITVGQLHRRQIDALAQLRTRIGHVKDDTDHDDLSSLLNAMEMLLVDGQVAMRALMFQRNNLQLELNLLRQIVKDDPAMDHLIKMAEQLVEEQAS